MRQLFIRVVLLVSGLVVGLGVTEVAIRVFHLAPEVVYIEKWRMRLAANPKIGYEPIPHLNSEGKSVQFYGYQGISNDLGFRDVSHVKSKPAGQKRVLVLGDSIVAGLWIEKDRDVYPAILQKKLRAAGGSVEVLNFGVSGYNTQQEVETLRDKGLAYKPDIVILTYCLNDSFADDGGIYFHLKEAEKAQGGLNVASLSPMLRESALYRFITYRVLTPPESEPQSDSVPEFLTEDNTEKYFQVLDMLRTEHAFEVYVVLFPDFDFIDRRTPSYAFFQEHKHIRDLASKHQFGFIDLYEPMKECKREIGELLLSFDRFHPRPTGNECAARAIAEELLQTSKVLKNESAPR